MTNNSFTNINKFALEEVHMIAGDQRVFTYIINNSSGAPLSLEGSTCSVIIVPFNDTTYVVGELSGSISGSSTFSVDFSGSGLSGAYQQIVKIIDTESKIHKPAQGKIIVFPAPAD
jgi:hypothetical protein